MRKERNERIYGIKKARERMATIQKHRDDGGTWLMSETEIKQKGNGMSTEAKDLKDNIRDAFR